MKISSSFLISCSSLVSGSVSQRELSLPLFLNNVFSLFLVVPVFIV